MGAGRPPIFNTPEEMQEAIEAYFDSLKVGDVQIKPPTVSGLAYHLGMSTEALRNYQQKDEFLATVKRAKQRVENSLEEHLLTGKSAVGAIFNLKNNFGWKDKTESHTTGDVTITVDTGIDRDEG